MAVSFANSGSRPSWFQSLLLLFQRPARLQIAALCVRENDGLREVLMVTSREAAKNNQGTHAYDVSDLIHGDTVGELAEAVHTALPQSVQESASISGYRNLMLVTGNREVHESVSRILHLIKGGLREVKAPTPTF